MKNIIFLDIDGVLNCQLFYDSEQFIEARKKDFNIRENYIESQICRKRISWLNGLCEETQSVIVVSSTWRSSYTVDELQELFNSMGGTFTVLDKTGHCESRVRGVEIKNWLHDNCEKYFGVMYFDFYRYAIIDDDSDMLLNQENHFFHCDNYSGLTPNTCYKIKRFFTHETF